MSLESIQVGAEQTHLLGELGHVHVLLGVHGFSEGRGCGCRGCTGHSAVKHSVLPCSPSRGGRYTAGSLSLQGIREDCCVRGRTTPHTGAEAKNVQDHSQFGNSHLVPYLHLCILEYALPPTGLRRLTIPFAWWRSSMALAAAALSSFPLPRGGQRCFGLRHSCCCKRQIRTTTNVSYSLATFRATGTAFHGCARSLGQTKPRTQGWLKHACLTAVIM